MALRHGAGWGCGGAGGWQAAEAAAGREAGLREEALRLEAAAAAARRAGMEAQHAAVRLQLRLVRPAGAEGSRRI